MRKKAASAPREPGSDSKFASPPRSRRARRPRESGSRPRAGSAMRLCAIARNGVCGQRQRSFFPYMVGKGTTMFLLPEPRRRPGPTWRCSTIWQMCYEEDTRRWTASTRPQNIRRPEEMRMLENLANVSSRVAVAMISFPIRIYRYCISPMLPHSCRFQPTCSAYALEALSRHGPLKGTWLTLRRLSRCHPIAWLGGGSGLDPVPPR
jgi:putative membrane protein insertion efficiency factor